MNHYLDNIEIDGNKYCYYSLKKLAEELSLDIIDTLPCSLKILLENLLRYNSPLVKNLLSKKGVEVDFMPHRVLMQDYTGVPAIADLAAMRDAVKEMGGDPARVNPQAPVDLIIDHSVQVGVAGNSEAYAENVRSEVEHNKERYQFLRWGHQAFENFRVVPPGNGICHQINLEYLAEVVVIKEQEDTSCPLLYPDSLVGTDSHTTMINALSVLGWGVGGIEAELVMLGQPIQMLVPEVIGFCLKGELPSGVTATDLVLTITNILRRYQTVGRFVEFCGDGLSYLSVADRATIANMAPEYGATCGFFPIDEKTLEYLQLTGRSKELIKVVEGYAKAQGLWRGENNYSFTENITLDLSTVKACLAGPKRPQDKVALADLSESFFAGFPEAKRYAENSKLQDGSVVIAAITSCTNTSNPSLMIAAGLVAKKAAELGLKSKPWVKTSLAPGSRVVSEYLDRSGLTPFLDQMGFNLVGYGCTTCIGNSGPLSDAIEEQIQEEQLTVASVLSGNRNFEGRIHALVKANYLGSPPLVVIYALAGTVNIDITKEAIGYGDSGPVYFADLWPDPEEIEEYTRRFVLPQTFIEKYKDIFKGDENWKSIETKKSILFPWDPTNTYVQRPPHFDKGEEKTIDLSVKAKILAVFGDNITTDHISPAGSIAVHSPAGEYLLKLGVEKSQFNSYGARRGNHNVMIRGTFANIRLRNELLRGAKEGGYTKYKGHITSIYEASMAFQREKVPLVIIAGKDYGTGSSRDWAGKGTFLLGVKAVIAESFERIHRSNLIGMGVLPLAFTEGATRLDMSLNGDEIIELQGQVGRGSIVNCLVHKEDGSIQSFKLRALIYTDHELRYYLSGGLLQCVAHDLCEGSVP